MARLHFLGLIAALAVAACGSEKTSPAASTEAAKPTIVLLHGAALSASSWDAVKAALEAKGRKVIAVDLPGRPSNPAPVTEVSLDVYRDTVLGAIAGETAPVILVGHSFGGFTISNVAEAAPEKIATLVYLAAFLPKTGDSLFALAATDADSLLGPALIIDETTGLGKVAEDQRAVIFCNDCTPEVAAQAAAQMVDEPVQPLGTPITVSEKFAGVRKIYIRTSLDNVISSSLQDRMMEATPVDEVIRFETGHSPFFSQPDMLADTLDKVVVQ